MSDQNIEAEPGEDGHEAQAVALERWTSKVYLRLEGGNSLECDNGELFLPPSGFEVRGIHVRRNEGDEHEVIVRIFDRAPTSIRIRHADSGQIHTHQGIKITAGGQEFYVGHWRGPLGEDCRLRAVELGALAQDEGTWVATKG